MKKNMRVVQINGFRGLILAIFTVCCLLAGFVVFPAIVTMHAWNYLSLKTGSFPTIELIGGILLWGIIAFSVYIFTKRKFIVSFNTQQELSDDEIKEVLSKIQSQTVKSHSILSKDINTKEDGKESKVEQKID